MSIALYIERGKAVLTKILSSGALLWVAGFLMAIGVFGLGRLYGQGEMIADIQLITQEISKPEITPSKPTTFKPVTEPAGERPPQEGQVVASKNGTKFHYPWCPGAKQIKTENKIFFTSESQAITAGFTKAANCN